MPFLLPHTRQAHVSTPFHVKWIRVNFKEVEFFKSYLATPQVKKGAPGKYSGHDEKVLVFLMNLINFVDNVLQTMFWI